MFLEDDDITVAEAISKLAQAVGFGLKYLGTGDNGSQMGAVEFHATQVVEASNVIHSGLEQVALAIEELARAVRATGE